jgi:hypothetical protein
MAAEATAAALVWPSIERWPRSLLRYSRRSTMRRARLVPGAWRPLVAIAHARLDDGDKARALASEHVDAGRRRGPHAPLRRRRAHRTSARGAHPRRRQAAPGGRHRHRLADAKRASRGGAGRLGDDQPRDRPGTLRVPERPSRSTSRTPTRSSTSAHAENCAERSGRADPARSRPSGPTNQLTAGAPCAGR